MENKGFVSRCAAHYYQDRFRKLSFNELSEQRDRLRQGLEAIAEEVGEIAQMVGSEAAKLRGDLERDAAEIRAKLVAVEGLLKEQSTSYGPPEHA